MTTEQFNDLTLAQQSAALAALRALIAAICAQRGGASEPQPVTVTRRGAWLGTARTGLQGREN